VTHPLDGFTSPEPLLVIGDDESAADLAPSGATFTTMAGATDIGRGWKSVLWMTSDRASLRARASAMPRVGQVRVVAVWLTDATVPLVVHPRPEWPMITSLMAREAARGVLTVLRFAAPVPAHQVLIECARQAADGDRGHGGLVVGYAGRDAAAGLDVRAPFFDAASDAGDPERDVPPDVVVTGFVTVAGATSSTAERTPAVHHVIDRAPLVVTDPGLEPIDEHVVNPQGWRKDWDEPVRDFGPGQQLTELAIEGLRGVQGLRVDLATADARTVAGLAMAGVPLLATGTNPALSEQLSNALTATPDLDDPLAREQHSVTTRRAALDAHSTLAWRRDLAERAGVRFVAQPKVSVMLATMRPHQLDFAMRQLARQQDVELQVVLGTHGWTVTEDEVRTLLGGRHDVVVRPHDKDAFFGDVLNDAATVADGDVLLKVDDDDWYAPHAIHDLLLARRYTGAEVVGMPSEFVYLEELGVTARRNHPTEIHNRFVAGGTIMIDRQLLRSVGGFRRVRRFVDAQLLNAVEASGGRIYRTHGLGYVLRRTASGHTWQSDPESFRKPEILEREWPGFRAPPELVIEEGDLP
jgi:Glycosyl transferase family 2